MREPTPMSPLQQAGIDQDRFGTDGLDLAAPAGMSIMRLHSLKEPGRLAAALEGAGLPFPQKVNQAAGRDPSVLCLRPSEWLLYGEERTSAPTLSRIGPILDEGRTALLNCAHGLAVFRLSGAAAPWLLSKIGSLDFLSAGISRQHCARTKLGACAVIVHHFPGSRGSVHDLLFDRSMTGYLWDLLRHSAPHASELAQQWAQS